MAEYAIELSYGGAVVKTITPPDKKAAKRCFYTHTQRQDYGVRLYIDGIPQSYNKATKHFGRSDNAMMFKDWQEEGADK